MTTAIVLRSADHASRTRAGLDLLRAQHLGRVAGIAAAVRADIDAGRAGARHPHPSRPFGAAVPWILTGALDPVSGIRVVRAAGEPVALFPAR